MTAATTTVPSLVEGADNCTRGAIVQEKKLDYAHAITYYEEGVKLLEEAKALTKNKSKQQEILQKYQSQLNARISYLKKNKKEPIEPVETHIPLAESKSLSNPKLRPTTMAAAAVGGIA
eukprot:Platyproteum_vivax@DN4795_c0_g1_i1.p1